MKKGVLKGPIHYQFVLGVAGGMRGNAGLPGLPAAQNAARFHLVYYWHWAVFICPACFWDWPRAARNGLRVGLEDNILMEKGVLATNVSLVERAVKLGELAGRSIAAPDEAREILGLTKHI